MTAEWTSLTQVVSWINEAGGQAVIAHPTRYRFTRSKLLRLVTAFKEAGGAGLEVITARTQTDEVQWISKLCRDFNLAASVGSDYHGPTTWAELGHLRPLPISCQAIWSQWSTVGQ